MSEANNRPSRDMQLESLEDRMLFDAVPIVDPELMNLVSDGGPEVTQIQSSEELVSRTEVVFVDAGVEDPDTLLAGFGTGNGNVEFQFLDASSDGLEQIADYLEGRSDIDAIHILSHGNQAELILGDAIISGDQLSLYAEELSAIGDALSTDGDILIYGCDLASDESGVAFVESFAGLTNADVAASDDFTGHADLGGDWELEVSSGAIEASVGVDSTTQDVWRHILPPDLYVLKDDGQTTADTGDVLIYTIDYGNSGVDDSSGVYISDTLPDGTTYSSVGSSFGWSETSSGSGVFEYAIGDLSTGTVGSINFAVTVDDPLAAGIDDIVNSVSIIDDGLAGQDSNVADNTAEDSNAIGATPELFVSKDDGVSTTTSGDTLTYTISYGNDGDQGATGVVLTETLPANTTYNGAGSSSGWSETSPGSGVFTFDLGLVAANSSGSVTFAIDVGATGGATELTNSVSITDDGANGVDPVSGNNTGTDVDSIVAGAIGVDLFVSKDDSQTTVLPNGSVVYTINYANNGDTAATGVELTETVPVGSTFDAANSDPNWVGGSGTYTLSVGGLAASATGSVAFAVTVDSPVAAGLNDLQNTVSIADDGANGADADASDNTAIDTNSVDAAPDLSVTKDDGSLTTSAGSTIIYTISYANNGNQDATNVVLRDVLPPNTSYDAGGSTVGWAETSSGSGVFLFNFATLAAGTGGTVNFAVTVDDPLAGSVTEITNNVTISDDDNNGADPDTSDNSASDTDSVGGAPVGVDLAVSKDDSQTTVLPNGTVVYTINYANNGDVPATGVVLTETVPTGATFDAAGSDPNWVGDGSGTYTLSLGTLPVGSFGSATFAVTVDDPVAAGLDDLVNVVSIVDDGTNGADADATDNTASDTDTITAAPDLSVSKTDGVTSAAGGDSLVYTISFANNGDQDATNVVLTDTLPPNTSYDLANSTPGWTETSAGSGVFTFDIASLAAGASGTVDFAVTVDDPLAGSVTSLTNSVTIADDGANGADPDTSDNSASDTDTVGGVVAGVDLAVTKDDSQTTVLPNGTVIYTISYANNGDTDATGVALIETVPTGSVFDATNSDPSWTGSGSTYLLNVGDLAAGASSSVTFAVTVDDPVAAGLDDLVNSVSIADDGANGADANLANNSDTDTDAITAVPDLSVTKSDGVATAAGGDTLIYTISYANNGDQDATNVVLTDTLPPNTSYDGANSTSGWTETSAGSGVFTFSIASVGAGTGGTVDFAVTVDNPLAGSVTSLTNTVTIADDGANGADPDTSDNSASDTDSVVGAAIGVDLAVTKDDSQTTVLPNGTVIYTINFANNGDTAASGVVLTETLPTGATFDAAGSDPNWVGGSSIYTLAVGNLAAGGTGSVTFAVTVDDPVAAGIDDLVNVVSIADDGANGADADASDNTASDTDTITAAPDLFVTKDDSITSTSAGSLVVYTITFGNDGNQDATGVVLTETLPPGATYDLANSTSGWSETSSGSGVFTFAVGDLAAGSTSSTVDFAVIVDDPVSVSQLVNNVSIADDGANGQDPDQTDNSDDDVDAIAAAGTPDLVVSKDNSQATVSAGGSVVYAISYSNIGPVGATGVVITETLPPGSTYDAANSTTGWTETSSGSGVFQFNVGPLSAGATGSVDFAVVIDDPVASGITQLVNNVIITDDGNNGADSNLSNNSDVESDPINGISGLNLFVNKDDGVTVANAGGTLIYAINYGNNGDVDATGVVLTETLPAGTTYDAANSSFGWNETSVGSGIFEFVVGPVNGGTSGSVAFAVTVDSPLSAGIDQLVNNVSIADDGTNGAETSAADNTDSDTDVVAGAPEYSITKDDGITEASPGQQITYTITVANNGTQDGTGIVVSDTYPSAVLENVTASNGGVVDAGGTITWNLGNLAAGNSVVLTVSATVVDTVGAGVDSFTNSVDVADDGANGADPILNNNADSDTDVLNAAPDLQVTKTDGGVTTNEGSVVVYTVNFANNGDQDATGVVLTETLPANTSYDLANSTAGWTETSSGSGVFTLDVGDLAANASGSVAFDVLVDTPLPTGTSQIDNSVTISDDGANGVDPDLTDNTGTDSTPVGNVPAYTVTKDANVTAIDADGTLTYTITVTNVGGAAGSDVVVQESFDLGVFETLLADNGGIVDAAGGTITWNLSSMAVGEVVVLTVTAQVEDTFVAGVDSVNCTVTVTDDDAAAVASASNSVALNAAPELQILKTTNAIAANSGATVIYTITYSNNGTQDATGVLIEEHIQPGTAFDAANSDAGWVARGDGEHIDFAAGALAVGESRTIQYAVTVTDVSLIGANLNNVVDVSDDGNNGGDPITANNAAVNLLSTADPDAPVYSVVKAGSVTEVTPEGTLTYTISVTNNGAAAGSDVEVKETFDLGVFGSMSADNNGVVDLDGGMVIWNIPTIAVGETVVLTVTAEVGSTLAAGVDVVNCNVMVTDDDAAAVVTADAQITLLAAPELTISKSISTGVVNNGDVLVYTVTYTNEGNQDATGVLIEEHIVPGTSFNAANSDASWVDRGDGEHIDYFVGPMAAGEVRTITFAVNIDDIDQIGDQLDNLIEISDDGANGIEANLDNNVQIVGVSTRVLDVEFLSKRLLLSTSSTGAYDALVPLSQLPSQQGNLPEAEPQTASSDPVAVPIVSESSNSDDEESNGLIGRFSRFLNR